MESPLIWLVSLNWAHPCADRGHVVDIWWGNKGREAQKWNDEELDARVCVSVDACEAKKRRQAVLPHQLFLKRSSKMCHWEHVSFYLQNSKKKKKKGSKVIQGHKHNPIWEQTQGFWLEPVPEHSSLISSSAKNGTAAVGWIIPINKYVNSSRKACRSRSCGHRGISFCPCGDDAEGLFSFFFFLNDMIMGNNKSG